MLRDNEYAEALIHYLEEQDENVTGKCGVEGCTRKTCFFSDCGLCWVHQIFFPIFFIIWLIKDGRAG